MNEQLSYILLLVIAGIISIAVAQYGWRHRAVFGAIPFTAMMLAITDWSLTNAAQLASQDLPAKILLAKVGYIGIALTPVCWLVFALLYTGREKWLTRTTAAVLALMPSITLLLLFTTEKHGLMWSRIWLEGDYMRVSYGKWFVVHAIFSYSSLLIGMILFIVMFIRSPRLYRWQAGIIVLGGLAPWISNVLYMTGLNPLKPLDPTPLAFTLTGLATAWGLFRFRLLDIVPVARDAIIEGLRDGVLVLDAHNRIVDLNPAVQRIIGPQAAQAIGRPAAQVLDARPDLVERYQDSMEAQAEVTLGTGDAQRDYEMRISPLANRRGRFSGRLVVLHDITERKRAEQALRESQLQVEASYRREMEFARQIQTSLLPAETFQVPKVDIAAFSQAAHHAGGDFYNYFVFDQNHLGIAVGDVSGKGMQAAIMMALSFGVLTHQVRREIGPAAFLAEMNQWIYPHTRRSNLNTALCYATLKFQANAWEMRVANAGMIAPLVRRASGKVEWLDVNGMPLGTAETIEYTEIEQRLGPGDVVILCSDGIIEAMNAGKEMYGFDRFERCVEATFKKPLADGRNHSALELREWILIDVCAFVGDAEMHDDMTMVVLVIGQ